MRIMESFDLSSDHSPIIVTYTTVAHILTKPYKVISANTDINAFKSYQPGNLAKIRRVDRPCCGVTHKQDP